MKKLLLIFGIITALTIISSCRDGVPKKIIEKKAKVKVFPKPKAIMKGYNRAISLKILQKKVREYLEKGSCPENILQLCEIKEIIGYVIDDEKKDIILIGKIDDTLPPLYLEDFIIAIKNTWMKYAELKGNTYYYSNPGCSIDPEPNVLNELQHLTNKIFNKLDQESIKRSREKWCDVCQKSQNVRILGIPFDTRFSKVMVEADYYMKRLVDGSDTLNIDGFMSLTDMALSIVRKEIEEGRQISLPSMSLNRFWFFPGENSFLEDKGVVFIKKSEVKLLTEEEFLTKRGDIAGSGRPNSLAQKFAESFSVKYIEIAKRKPIYAELEALFRFVALAKIMKQKNAIRKSGINIDYFMDEFPITKINVNRTLPGISNIKEFTYKSETQEGYSEFYFWLPSCGGVSIDIDIKDIIKDETGSLVKTKKVVIKSRPTDDSLYWDFINNKEAI